MLTDLKVPVSLLFPTLPLSRCGVVGETLGAELEDTVALGVKLIAGAVEALVDGDEEF